MSRYSEAHRRTVARQPAPTALDAVVDLVMTRRGRPGSDFPGSLQGSPS
jgi:hypothetical protein